MAVDLHGPPRQPRDRPRRRAESRRTSGVERVRGDAADRALLPYPQARGPRRGEAACGADLSCHPVSDGAPDQGEDDQLPRPRRRAILPLAHQGHRRHRPLDRLGRSRRRGGRVRQSRAGLSGCARLGQAVERGPHGRAAGRCRTRRGQRLRGSAGILEARPEEVLVDHRLQPPEPRQRRLRPALPEDGRRLRDDGLARRHGEVRQAAAGGVCAPRRRAPAPLDRRLPQPRLFRADLRRRRGLPQADPEGRHGLPARRWS